MARKTPVLARDLGSLTEIVQESGGGLLYKSDADFLSAIQELLASQERRDLLGGKGYRQYESSWTPESHLAGYQRILRETSLRRHGKVLWKE